nr:zinc finger CCCH domain-containing protein 3-like isoform X2 [Parasteatoda tepidariorum]
MMASRALNRSINQATRKKMQKINSYCMFYNRFGRCNKGIKCAFVHDPSKIAVCTRFLRGTCKSEKCLFSHEINPGKMALCSFFLQNACTKKDCPYLHEQLSSDAELCKAFVQGYCPNGKTCKKAHILICTKFLRGQCDKGKDCIFPHPVKKEILINPKSCSEEKDEFQLETVLRYFESNPQESLSLVVPSRVKSLPQQQDFISLEKR